MSKATRGGGKDNELVIIEANRVFETKLFTFAEAHTFVSGWDRPLQTNLLNSGELKTVKVPSGYVHNSRLSGAYTIYASYPKLYAFIPNTKMKTKETDLVVVVSCN
jgi:hypothetical protein